jgi:NADH-quinone oxidoreductase subunit J
MLLNAGEEERTNVSRLARFVGVPLGIVFLAEVAYWIWRATSHLGSGPNEAVSTRDLSTLLFREYVFPFELTSFLILIALLGAMVLARREESD